LRLEGRAPAEERAPRRRDRFNDDWCSTLVRRTLTLHVRRDRAQTFSNPEVHAILGQSEECLRGFAQVTRELFAERSGGVVRRFHRRARCVGAFSLLSTQANARAARLFQSVCSHRKLVWFLRFVTSEPHHITPISLGYAWGEPISWDSGSAARSDKRPRGLPHDRTRPAGPGTKTLVQTSVHGRARFRVPRPAYAPSGGWHGN